jgi:hypothetical protein
VAAEDILQLHGVPLGEGALQSAHLVLQFVGLLLLGGTNMATIIYFYNKTGKYLNAV